MTPFNFTELASPTSTAIATWIIAISLAISTVISMLAFLGLAQGIQIRFLKGQIEARLRILEGYVNEAKKKARDYLVSIGSNNPDAVVERVSEYFVIEPVSLEPTDIVRRLERILRTEESRIESIVNTSASRASEVEKQIAVTLLAIANALNLTYLYLRHLLLLGVKTRNALLIAQLWMMLPLIMRIAKAYRDAIPGIAEGKPIGDSLGPLVAYRLMVKLKANEVNMIAKETVYAKASLNGVQLYIVKAKGPGSTVGRPGEAVEKIVENDPSVSMIITVDAALKFEGEPSGKVAEGAGAAIGDPGPEKIRIERAAVKRGIPLHAIVVKMGLEESIQPMREEIEKSVDKVVERVIELVRMYTKPGDSVVVVGVGNTIGVGQVG